VGKKTPLSEALVYADQYLSIYGRKHPGDQLFCILLTDATANIPLSEDNDPFEEAIAIAGRMNSPVAWIVVDTAANPAEDSKGVKLAQALHAAYYRMDDLRNPDGTPVLK
jgi:magnesium chelatase subunit D